MEFKNNASGTRLSSQRHLLVKNASPAVEAVESTSFWLRNNTAHSMYHPVCDCFIFPEIYQTDSYRALSTLVPKGYCSSIFIMFETNFCPQCINLKKTNWAYFSCKHLFIDTRVIPLQQVNKIIQLGK